MSQTSNESGVGAVAIVLVIAVLAIVGVAGFKVMQKNDDKMATDTNSSMTHDDTATKSSDKASDLRATLVTLGVEHMQLTASAVDSALDGNKDAGAVGKALYKNGTDIGAAVGSVYGADAEKTFNSVWKLHLDEFVNYAVAGSKKDEAGKKAALAKIDSDYTKPLSAYLAKANPNLPEATLNTVLGDHVTMTAAMIDAHNAGKYDEEQTELNKATKHIEVIFSTLAGAIAKQYPDKF